MARVSVTERQQDLLAEMTASRGDFRSLADLRARVVNFVADHHRLLTESYQ